MGALYNYIEIKKLKIHANLSLNDWTDGMYFFIGLITFLQLST